MLEICVGSGQVSIKVWLLLNFQCIFRILVILTSNRSGNFMSYYVFGCIAGPSMTIYSVLLKHLHSI